MKQVSPKRHSDSELVPSAKETIKSWWRRYTTSHIIKSKPGLFSQFVDEGDLVFDIGASRGGMTWCFRQIGCTVIAVEPLQSTAPEYIPEFGWMFDADPDVILLPYAVSPDDRVEIAVNLNQHYLSSCSKRWRTESAHARMYGKCRYERIEGIRIDWIIAEYGEPRFIKFDCEGYNAEAISTLTVPIKSLNMEFHKDWLWNNAQAIMHIDSLGDYEYNFAYDNQGVLALDHWTSGPALLQILNDVLVDKGKGSWGDIYARRID